MGELPSDDTPLEKFTDEQLWAIVYRPFSFSQDARLRELTRWSKAGSLSESEQQELENLVNIFDKFVLLRSQALLLLKERGHDVEQRLKLGA